MVHVAEYRNIRESSSSITHRHKFSPHRHDCGWQILTHEQHRILFSPSSSSSRFYSTCRAFKDVVDRSHFRWEWISCRCCSAIWCSSNNKDENFRNWKTIDTSSFIISKAKKRFLLLPTVFKAHWLLIHKGPFCKELIARFQRLVECMKSASGYRSLSHKFRRHPLVPSQARRE